MGIEITFNGSLKDPALIDTFIEDMVQRCEKIKWKYEVQDEWIKGQAAVLTAKGDMELRQVDERIRGIAILPPKTEVFLLTFDVNGKMSGYEPFSPAGVFSMTGNEQAIDTNDRANRKISPGYYFGCEGNFIKVTGALQSHVMIVAFLRYIRKHYCPTLKVKDPTGLWRTQNIEHFEQVHRQMQLMIGAVALSLEEAGILKENIKLFDNAEPPPLVKAPPFVKPTGMGTNNN